MSCQKVTRKIMTISVVPLSKKAIIQSRQVQLRKMKNWVLQYVTRLKKVTSSMARLSCIVGCLAHQMLAQSVAVLSYMTWVVKKCMRVIIVLSVATTKPQQSLPPKPIHDTWFGKSHCKQSHSSSPKCPAGVALKYLGTPEYKWREVSSIQMFRVWAREKYKAKV